MLIDRDSNATTITRPTASVNTVSVSPSAAITEPFQSSEYPDFWVEVCTDKQRLLEHEAAWQNLIENCIDPNAFYEPNVLLPAIDYLHAEGEWQIALVFRKNQRVTDPPILCGLFPLQQDRVPGIRLRRLQPLLNWYTYASTPLLHTSYAGEAWDMLLCWARNERVSVIEYPRLRGDGPAAQALTDVLNYRRLQACVLDRHNRALLVRGEDVESYQARNVRGHKSRDMRRLRRRLEEQGQLEFRTMEDLSQLTYWADCFLELESKGWKGQSGTAVQQNQGHADFFRETLNRSWTAGRLQMLGLFLNGEPIALKCNLLSPSGSYAWKIAYDESLSKFSPGVQLEQENIRVFHEETDLQWMDSCAIAAHSMINRLWCDRRAIDHLLIPTGRLAGELFASAYPLLRLTKKRIKQVLGRSAKTSR